MKYVRRLGVENAVVCDELIDESEGGDVVCPPRPPCSTLVDNQYHYYMKIITLSEYEYIPTNVNSHDFAFCDLKYIWIRRNHARRDLLLLLSAMLSFQRSVMSSSNPPREKLIEE